MAVNSAKMALKYVKKSLSGNQKKVVSLRYYSRKMEENAAHWYALKVFYNKVFDMEAALGDQGYTTYLATDRRLLKGLEHSRARKKLTQLKLDGLTDNHYIEEGPVIFQRIPMVSSLLFVQADENDIKVIDNDLREGKYRVQGFIYKRKQESDGRYICASIPDKQMETFRMVTKKGSEGLDFFSCEDISHFQCGNKVRVKDGPFKGAEGYIKRIKRDRRLLISIEGIVAVATAHIDPSLLEVIPQ